MKLLYVLLPLLYGVQVSLAVNNADLIRLARQIEENVPQVLKQQTNVIDDLVISKQAELNARADAMKAAIGNLSRTRECFAYQEQIDRIVKFQINFHYSFRDCANSDGLKAAGNMVKDLIPIRQRIAELIRTCNPYTEICFAKFEEIDRELNMMYNGFIQRAGSIVEYSAACIRDRGNSIVRSLYYVYNMWQQKCPPPITTTPKPVTTATVKV